MQRNGGAKENNIRELNKWFEELKFNGLNLFTQDLDCSPTVKKKRKKKGDTVSVRFLSFSQIRGWRPNGVTIM